MIKPELREKILLAIAIRYNQWEGEHPIDNECKNWETDAQVCHELIRGGFSWETASRNGINPPNGYSWYNIPVEEFFFKKCCTL